MDNLEIINYLSASQQEQVRYGWDEDFQRVVMGLLLCDRYFLTQSSGLIQPSYFISEVHQMACRILFKYFEDYRQLPSKIYMRQTITDRLRERYQNQDNDTFLTVKLLYLAEINTVYDYYSKGGVGDMMPALDSPEAILDRVTIFAKSQAMKQAFHKCLELIRRNPESDETWSKVDEIIKEARLVERQTDLGLDYFGTMEERYERMAMAQETAEVFSSGFDTIDRALHGGGLMRGEIGAWMGLAGTGKSLALVTASVKNIMNSKKVLYVSTEMDQDRIATRFDAQISLIGQHQLMLRKEEVWRALRQEASDYEDKRRLVIKQFPSGTADVNTVRAYHSQLLMYGFHPDLVIIDYIGDMKDIAGIPTWESKFRLLRDLRGFGKVENHCTLTAIQPNRGATELGQEEFMDESKQGGSFMQNQVLDAFWSLNQTANEQKAGIGRIFVAKARNGKSRFSFKICYNYEPQTLNLQEISDEAYRVRLSKVKDGQSEDVNIDKIVTGGRWQPSEGESVS